jgi:hypothetical protein
MEFVEFANAIRDKFNEMSKGNLFVVDADPDELWNHYLNSFPEGTNRTFRERREYDCQSCKQFVRQVGNVVAIKDGRLESIWSISILDSTFQTVALNMDLYVTERKIKNVFVHSDPRVGKRWNTEIKPNGDEITWHHFAVAIPKCYQKPAQDIGSYLGKVKSKYDVTFRGLNELTLESAEIVLELIEEGSLYRGEEHKRAVEMYVDAKKQFDKAENKEVFVWDDVIGLPSIRNTAIGSLLVDISGGKQLDEVVRLFESKVAPTNYKRTKGVVTKRMIQAAEQKVKELGIADSLQRRCAVTEDITVNNVIYVDRAVKQIIGGSVFDELIEETQDSIKNRDKIEPVTIDNFITNILPKSNNVELYFENKHKNNLMTLISPKHRDSPNILKWGNNFSWSYNGDVTDSIKENVKKAGGRVEGVLRFSIQWNEKNDNRNDFDAHCIEPNNNRIYFENKGRLHSSSGMLDVDIIHPKGVAVENIIYTEYENMPYGDYAFKVHNYTDRGGVSGFRAEIEFNGQSYSFDYSEKVRQGAYVDVAVVNYSKEGFKIKSMIPSSVSNQEVYSINSNKYHRVNMIMKSPNHWDGEETGNKHYFFIIDKCRTDKDIRGLYNEFLNEGLREHRKVFEVLGNKLKAKPTENQLSGFGFSSTRKDEVLCRVKGSFNRILKIQF